MSWGKDLWDQTDVISVHTLKGIEFLEKCSAFVKDRCVIEQQYASSLRNLVKKHQSKKKEEDVFTSNVAFREILNELSDLAGQHEVMVEGFQDRIVTEIAKLIKELKEQRKMLLSEVDRLEQNRLNAVESMKKAKKEYEKACREAELSESKYKKAEADINLSRADVKKAKLNYMSRTQQADDTKATYASELEKTNNYQKQFYSELLPNVLQKLQQMDEDRITQVRRLFCMCVEVESSVIPIVQRCFDGMLKEANKVDPATDSRTLVDRYRSGYGLPEEFPFVDLNPGPAASASISEEQNGFSNCTDGTCSRANSLSSCRIDSKQLQRAYSGRKKGGTLRRIFGNKWSEDHGKEFADLPPSQQCKQIEEQMLRCEKTIEKTQAEKQGLLKMKGAYAANPSYGDPVVVAGQLERCETELKTATNELQRLKELHVEASARLNMPINATSVPFVNTSASKHTKRSSLSDESLSRNSDASPRNSSSQDVHSCLASESSFRNVDSDCDSANNLYYNNDTDDTVILGRATALYDFAGGSEGMISIRQGDQLLIVEVDTGDGWTKVRRTKAGPDFGGFVPSSYLKLEFYGDT
uniref:SH3 domain-containing protein n=1 Tax=Trichuris muris TaxID=70415 RepID=A0A5S6QVQ9_TRIMR